jgi:hypothetical protein
MTKKLSRHSYVTITLVVGFASVLHGQILIPGTKAKPDAKEGAAHGGCSLTASAAEGMQGQLQLSRTVWNPAQDAAFDDILAHLDSLYGVNPAFFIFNDQGSPNAFATPKKFDPRYADGSVVFGYQLFNSEIQQTGRVNFTIAAIMAHEFAHILQFKVGEELPTKLSELEADYMAGWYLGSVSGTWLGVTSSQALRSFFNKGDYSFNSPTHHGTPDERVHAVEAGLRDRGQPWRRAFANAHAYVTSN